MYNNIFIIQCRSITTKDKDTEDIREKAPEVKQAEKDFVKLFSTKKNEESEDGHLSEPEKSLSWSDEVSRTDMCSYNSSRELSVYTSSMENKRTIDHFLCLTKC